MFQQTQQRRAFQFLNMCRNWCLLPASSGWLEAVGYFQTLSAIVGSTVTLSVFYFRLNLNSPLFAMADGAEDAGNETITLRVKDQTGDEMFFKVKKNTKMQVCKGTCATEYKLHFTSPSVITIVGINPPANILRLFLPY